MSCNINFSVHPLPNSGVDPPRIDYFFPRGVIKSPPGDTVEIISIIISTQPLSVTWEHNGSRLVNQTTINDTHFLLTEVIYSENNIICSILTITNVGEGAQGVYKVVAINNGGRAESAEAELMLGEFLNGLATHPHNCLRVSLC